MPGRRAALLTCALLWLPLTRPAATVVTQPSPSPAGTATNGAFHDQVPVTMVPLTVPTGTPAALPSAVATTPAAGVSPTVTVTATPTITATPAVTAATPTPAITGGHWVTPAARFTVRGDILRVAVQAHAAAGRAVERVDVVAQWPGTRRVVCTLARPSSAPAVYACNWNVTRSGVPNGPLVLSFDVYDTAGRLTVSPDGTRQGLVAQPIRKVIVLLQGVCTSIDAGTGVANSTFNDLRALLDHDDGYRDADFLLYSYKGGVVDSNGVWHHRAYNSFDPIRQDVQTTSWSALQDQLLAPYHARHPNTTFILVGHSLGGVVALEEILKTVESPHYRHGFISAVITIDSPLHGVRPAELLLSDLLRLYPHIGSSLDCVTKGQAAKMLASLHQDAKTSSILAQAARRARQQGVTLVTAGNLDDCVWAPDKCGGPPIGDAQTQWITAPGSRSGVFRVPKPCLGREQRCFIGTHGAVLNKHDGPTALRAIAGYIGRQTGR